jgi:microcystin-dependent protein
MGTPFLGELRIMSFGFAPQGWAMCNGQFLPINQNQALFSLLGTMYGGNGQTTFALPDLRGQTPIHVGGSFNVQGQKGGSPSVTVNIQQLPTHVHPLQASKDNSGTNTGTGNFLGQAVTLYHGPSTLTTLSPSSVSNVGGNQPHNNMMPYLTLNFCIALQGLFPSRN